jgi:3-oxoacid CoA-transferase A subunit
MNKVFSSAKEAVSDIFDGATIMVGGYVIGPAMSPGALIDAVYELGVKNITLITQTVAPTKEWAKDKFPPHGVSVPSIWFEKRQVKKVINTYPYHPFKIDSLFRRQYLAGEVEMEVYPMGTFAEKIRAGGAGIGGFYTRTGTGVGGAVERGKEKKVIDGVEYILELPLKADFALIKAHKADTMGNLVYKGCNRNFNPVMATAAKITIAQVDEIVEAGELDPEVIVTPGIYVHRLVQVPPIPWSKDWGLVTPRG